MRCIVTIDAPTWKKPDNTQGRGRERQQYRDNEVGLMLKHMADRIAGGNAHEGTFTRDEISGSFKFED